MTITDAPNWTLSEHARIQLQECGIALSEVYRVLRKPQIVTHLGTSTRHSGYGLCVMLEDDTQITSIVIDGATGENWGEWALERAQFSDGDVAGADALLRQDFALPLVEDEPEEIPTVLRPAPTPRPRRSRQKKIHPPLPSEGLKTSHVLDQIHPALREEITRQVDGDFSRLVVHSPMNVTISPPK